MKEGWEFPEVSKLPEEEAMREEEEEEIVKRNGEKRKLKKERGERRVPGKGVSWGIVDCILVKSRGFD